MNFLSELVLTVLICKKIENKDDEGEAGGGGDGLGQCGHGRETDAMRVGEIKGKRGRGGACRGHLVP
jgi:hypothetical protein